MAGRDEIIAFCDELLDVGAFDDYGPERAPGPGRRRGEQGRHRRLGPPRAARARPRRRRPAGARPPRAVLGLPPARALRADGGPAADRARGRDLGRRLPPAARRPSARSATTPCSAPGSASSPTREPFAEVRGRAIGAIGRRARADRRPPSCSPPSASCSAASRSSSTPGPARCARSGSSPAPAPRQLGAAVALGLDAFLTGEPAEHAMADAREGGRPLHRRRPLRDRDARHPPPRRAGRRAVRDRARVHRRPEPGLSAGRVQVPARCGKTR